MSTQLDAGQAGDAFLDRLRDQAQRKRALYDGVKGTRAVGFRDTPDVWLRFLTEEVGEIAAAITRERWQLAMAECLDVAHCAMLLYLVLEGKEKSDAR